MNSKTAVDTAAAQLTATAMKIGGAYNWKHAERDQLIYLGKAGAWHQFRKIGDPRTVWCEVLDSELHMIEATKAAATPAAQPSALAALTELVSVKDLKDRTEALSFAGPIAGENWREEYDAGRKEYIRRQPLAWEAARAVLAATPVAQPSAEPGVYWTWESFYETENDRARWHRVYGDEPPMAKHTHSPIRGVTRLAAAPAGAGEPTEPHHEP